MNKTNNQIIFFSLSIIAICFIEIIIFTRPALSEQLDLTTKGNIGDTIGGITAPLIGIISSVLLYLALTRQTESNRDQKIKSESDLIFLLLNQLDNELNSFYYKFSQGKEEKKYTGLEGLNDFCRHYRYDNNIEQFRNKENFSFKDWYESGQIALIIDTFSLIEKRIEISNLSSELKTLFYTKLNSFYDCKLKTPLTSLSEAFDIYEFQKDNYTGRIQSIVIRFANNSS